VRQDVSDCMCVIITVCDVHMMCVMFKSASTPTNITLAIAHCGRHRAC
jgi:hypothetical protein